jgi:predicted  nucleic acid-binding Zn-ribbon protein
MTMIPALFMGLFNSEKKERKQLAKLQSEIMKKNEELNKWQSELDRTKADLGELDTAKKTLQSSIQMEKNQRERKIKAKAEIKAIKKKKKKKKKKNNLIQKIITFFSKNK